MVRVVLKNLKKTYPNGFKAVHGINLEINKGEFMVFVGPSGCAKSTTLRMIAGLESISSGEIYIGDKLVNNVSAKDRKIAMVFQNYALYPHMNVYNNMAFGLKIAKFPKEEIDTRVKEAAEILGITDLLKIKPKNMSGGQRQRVAVGRAIVRKPDVFLFDEPLSNLDAKLRIHMRLELTNLHQNLKATMIYVTHDQVEAMTMGDRICVMQAGKIMQVDTPVKLYNAPKNRFVAGFIGSPSMNILSAKLVQKKENFYVQTQNVSLKLPKKKIHKIQDYVGREILFGIRAGNITNNSSQKENFVDITVHIVEQMGHEMFIHFDLGTNRLVARLDSDPKVVPGKKCRLWFNMDKCHIFDKQTEENISL